ncbi:MAG: HD-GYP domain-containing protein [Clostridium baratii]|uniref:HD-GYP domain-containing protein n=1 Tax=Clostridium baratii TaxID=1561 RepID=UPI0006C04F1B|nr:HD-GYP domain-containing protein [Clostridium baratii]MBS6007803.1 HD-GYP domain-containing protein [Clostridium baratii]MDU1054597.1 HD-GYP domain-containing protein [Clostridium baratii]MDU4911388.1 HD-GYP domain-containing protein [Clostridium baratii]CUP72930.1 HD-GYP hydrolase domain-containing protein [Clostridium baratii]
MGVIPIDIKFSIIPYIRNKLNTVLSNIFKDYKITSILSENIVDEILDNDLILFTLLELKNKDEYTYRHSVSVATFSLALGISLNLNIKDLKELFIGALLHDIGKLFVPSSILLKKGALTTEEFEIMKGHPKKGYNYLILKNLGISNKALRICLEHHERIDGTGYPNNLKLNEIGILSKIVSIADVYDALTSNRSYRTPLNADDALNYINLNINSTFDEVLSKIFCKIIRLNPKDKPSISINPNILEINSQIHNTSLLKPTIKLINNSNYKLKYTSKFVKNFNIN